MNGKSEEECEKHILRYNKKYIPVTIKEQIKILNNCGFKNAEIHIKNAVISSEIPILSSFRTFSKIRDRSLELIEYYILLEGQYEFVFVS